MLRLGLPIGVHQWLEIAAFGGALVLMGLFGTVPLAAHNITITIVALTYMVPLGTSAAAAVLVGHAIGRGDADGARREASAALACGVGFMVLSAVTITLFPRAMASVFSTEEVVVTLAAQLLPIAAAFQVFDGVQGVASGILRGAGDTRVPMLLNLIGFGLVGLPVSALLAFPIGMGPAGLWWGLVICLVVVAGLLAWRVHVRLGGPLSRVETSGAVSAGFAAPH
jgi:MATE family multidrug resistance protein